MDSAASVSALLLLALVGGFLFTYRCHVFSYQAARVEGQRLLFVAAGWAVILLIASRLLLLAAPYIFAEYLVNSVARFWGALVEPVAGIALPTFFGALVLGPTLAWSVNQFYRPKAAGARAVQKYGGELEKLLYRAWRDELLVSVNLENRKVYVGWPIFTPDPRRNTEDLRLLPALSGYRSEADLRLNFTTQYFPAYRRIADSPSLGLRAADFAIAIPLSNLVSVNLFSLKVPQSLFQIPSSGEAGSTESPGAVAAG